jgi:hypothetical protein
VKWAEEQLILGNGIRPSATSAKTSSGSQISAERFDEPELLDQLHSTASVFDMSWTDLIGDIVG